MSEEAIGKGGRPEGGRGCSVCSSSINRTQPRGRREGRGERRRLAVFTNGRAGGFVSHAYGDGYPQPRYGIDPTTGNVRLSVDTPQVGWRLQVPSAENGLAHRSQPHGPATRSRTRAPSSSDPRPQRLHRQHLRLRYSGKLTEWTTLSVYLQFWSFIENDGRQKNLPNNSDVRQGWAKLEGPWVASPPAGCGASSRAGIRTSTCSTPTDGASAGREPSTTRDPRWDSCRSASSARAFRPG